MEDSQKGMLGKMLLAAIAMILGFSAIFIGCMLAFVGRNADLGLGMMVILAGLIIGPGCLWYVIKLNRDYQDVAIEKVLANPESILLQWEQEDKTIIITKEALFINNKFYPFTTYQKLVNLHYLHKDGKDLLQFEFESTMTRKLDLVPISVEVPNANSEQAKQLSQVLKNQYLLD
ncbi:MAG: hypothetical protein GY810_32215 [Aureispira sp.]|nr:hypothetical protein [Aureispira sp.]